MAIYRILVTGGCGFLGQHVIKLIQEKLDFVAHIRVLDVEEFVAKLDYDAPKPVEVVTGSITNGEDLDIATKGVNCVIHIASIVALGTGIDLDALYKVNVQGTNALLEAAKRQNVNQFIYCSTMCVAVGFEDIVGGTEDMGKPAEFMYGHYAKSKYQAESDVLKWNGTVLNNGQYLRTLSLRPSLIYGELNPHFVSTVLRTAKLLGGVLMRYAGSDTFHPHVYVGNVAWGFVCAVDSLHRHKDLGGEIFFITDDTPLLNTFDFSRPYLENVGMRVSTLVIPYQIMYVLVTLWVFLVWLLSPVVRIQSAFSRCALQQIKLRVSFQYSKATRMLSYRPMFSPEESQRRSLKYYSNMNK